MSPEPVLMKYDYKDLPIYSLESDANNSLTKTYSVLVHPFSLVFKGSGESQSRAGMRFYVLRD